MTNLIPAPKHISCGEAECRLSSFSVIKFPAGMSDYPLTLLKNRFPEGRFAGTEDGWGITMSADGGLFSAVVPEHENGYILSISPKGVVLRAQTEEALCHGVYTLLQLPDTVTECTISDYPSLPIRMIHLDLKGYRPHLEVLLEELRLLASYKVNAVLLELEDKYQYRCAPEIAVENAYTYEEMRVLSETAKALHIMIVPKLQCVAHADYVLKHEKYIHLCDGGNLFQYDPCNPEVKPLWDAMCDELMDCFREHTDYFHIGADECRLTPEAYYKRVGESIDHVLSHGRTPIMWDDILRKNPTITVDGEERSLRKLLGEKAVFMYWEYYGGEAGGLPHLQTYKDEGLRVWGASCYAGGERWASSVPSLRIRGQNIDLWTDLAVERGLEGVCATGWTRVSSADCPEEPTECAWFPMLYAAAGMWSGEGQNYETFARSLFRQLYGTEAEEGMLSVLLGDPPPEAVGFNFDPVVVGFPEAAAVEGCDRLRFLYMAAALESVATDRKWLLNYYQAFDAKLYGRLESYRHRFMTGFCDELLAKWATQRAAASPVLALFYDKGTVEEVLHTRFGYLERLATEMKGMIEQTESIGGSDVTVIEQ